jgi:hypothetical protein
MSGHILFLPNLGTLLKFIARLKGLTDKAQALLNFASIDQGTASQEVSLNAIQTFKSINGA